MTAVAIAQATTDVDGLGAVGTLAPGCGCERPWLVSTEDRSRCLKVSRLPAIRVRAGSSTAGCATADPRARRG